MSTKKVGVKGKGLHSQTRELIANVLNFMKEEAENGPKIPLNNYRERLLAATKISLTTYKRIKKEADGVASGTCHRFSTPKKKRMRSSPKSTLLEGEIEVLRRIIHQFTTVEKKQPTLKGIHAKFLQSGVEFNGGISTLSTIIKKMGFTWRKTTDNRMVLHESFDIRLKRINYLKQWKLYTEENRNKIYNDESYIHGSHTTSKGWSDGSNVFNKKPISKGQRAIMVHAGSKDGFVPNALLIFKSGTKSGDYHDEMNHQNFMRWVRTQLIPNIPPKSVLIVDNASYHNVTLIKDPTSASKKQEMITWLVQRNILHDPKQTKPELYAIIKQHKNKNPVYVLDTEMEQHGHRVLRLPPYHPELNPIEKIWALVKNWVASKNVTFKLNDVIQLAYEKFAMVTPEEWNKVCQHVDNVVAKYMANEHLLDEAMEQLEFVVNTGDSDREFSDLSDEDDEMSGVEFLNDEDN